MVNDSGNFGMLIFIAIITAFIVQIIVSYLTFREKEKSLKEREKYGKWGKRKTDDI